MAERELNFGEALNEAMRQEMQRDPKVVIMGEDVAGGADVDHLEGDEAWGGVLGVTKGLVKEFGRARVIDTPISESGFIGAAVGAAATGLRPIAEMMFVGFMGVCFDQLLNQGAKLRYMFGGKAKVPLVIRTICGGGYRAAAQHSQVLHSLFTHIPGLKTVVPSTPYDAKGLLISAIRDDDLVIFFEDITFGGIKGSVPEEDYSIPFGKADIKRAGENTGEKRWSDFYPLPNPTRFTPEPIKYSSVEFRPPLARCAETGRKTAARGSGAQQGAAGKRHTRSSSLDRCLGSSKGRFDTEKNVSLGRIEKHTQGRH